MLISKTDIAKAKELINKYQSGQINLSIASEKLDKLINWFSFNSGDIENETIEIIDRLLDIYYMENPTLETITGNLFKESGLTLSYCSFYNKENKIIVIRDGYKEELRFVNFEGFIHINLGEDVYNQLFYYLESERGNHNEQI